MRLKSGPFIIAAGLGAALHFIVTLLGTGATYLTSSSLFSDPARAFEVDQTPLVLASALSGLVCVCAAVFDFATGAGYSLLARRSGEVDVGDGAIGGLASALVARLISGVFGAAVSVAATALMFNQAGLSAGPESSSVIIAAVTGGAIGAVIGVCIGGVAGAMLCAAGGGVAAALASRSSA